MVDGERGQGDEEGDGGDDGERSDEAAVGSGIIGGWVGFCRGHALWGMLAGSGPRITLFGWG